MNLLDTRLHVLVVDDEPLLRTLLARGLENQNYRVTEADNGEKALDICAQHKLDLVLMDVSMPVMGGFAACNQLHQQFPYLPIIMLTGHDDLASINTAFEVGATDFMTKPINLPLLGQRVRYALRSTTAIRELSRVYHDQKTACRLAKLGFWKLDVRSGRLNWSKDAHKLVGLEYMPKQIQDLFSLLTSEQVNKMTVTFLAVINTGSPLDTEIVIGEGKFMRYLRLMADNVLEPHIISGAFQDITEQRSREQQIAYLAEHNSINGLPKRGLFLSQLQAQMDDSDQNVKWVVATLDISRLQRISGALGSDAGDQLLIMVAQRLAKTLPKPHLLGCLQNDCFIIGLPLGVAEGQCLDWLCSLLSPLEEPWQLEKQQVLLNFNIGFAVHTGQTQADQLLQASVRAKMQVTPSGRLSLLADTMLPYEDQGAALLLESQVRIALEREQFFLLYQPQQHLNESHITSVEALARWQHPDGSIVSPDQFIVLLENMGLMPIFSEWVLRTACQQALQWQNMGLKLTVALNVSASQFASPDLVEKFVSICNEECCPTSLLEIEVTESMAMTNPSQAIEHFKALKKNGFRVAIDDFGVGYSSMEYLLHFPHDVLKIDRTFVKNITDCKGSRAIVRAITAFCQSMQTTCIAEGVEDLRQRDYLDALGVDMIQGYLLSKPISAEDIVHLLEPALKPGYLMPAEPV